MRALKGIGIRRPAKLFVLLLAAALAGAGGFLLYRWFSERARPTVLGWRAAVSIYAGDGAPGARDGEAARARFADPFGVAVDREGNIYVADAANSNRVRRVTPEGRVNTLAGGAEEGFRDGHGAAAYFNTPSGLALDREGNLYVADTANNRVRKIDPAGRVTTLAGDGTAGWRDGAGAKAQFNGPVGVAVDEAGNVYVADTYNDRVRQITPDGEVRTLAGGGEPGYRDGPAVEALFDTPCGVAVGAGGTVFVADTGNHRVRRISPDGQVTTLSIKLADGAEGTPDVPESPLGIALTHDDFLYVTEKDRGRVLQVAPDGTARVVAGAGGGGFAGGVGVEARFNQPAGVAVDRRGVLYVADGANYVIRKLAPVEEVAKKASGGEVVSAAAPGERQEVLPRISAETLGVARMPWPLDPQDERHEVVATLGEVRGSYDGESRHHLHAGIDIQGAHGAVVRSVYDEKITSPLPNWGFEGLNEGVRVGLLTYVHLRVGRDERGDPLANTPFQVLKGADGKAARVRVKRGTRLRVGQAVGTVNRMYHVHLNYGPWGAEANPLQLPFVGFRDSVAPRIEPGGVYLFDRAGNKIGEKRDGRIVVRGDMSIVVDAYDQADGNLARRRLGLYQLGYQILNEDGTPAPGFEQPRVNLLFDRLPPQREAVKLAYADSSGITVYGSAATRFLYVVTNVVRGGRAAEDFWRASELSPGNYVVRILAADFAGNEAREGRDLPVRVER